MNKSMRVIQILPKMKAGGVERGVLDLARFFKNKDDGQKLESLVISAGGELLYLLDEWGIKHYQVRVERKSFLSLFAIPKVARIILKEEADIIHARSRVPAWISFFASRNKNCHFLTTAHGMYKNRFSSEVMGWGKFVVCPSKVVARHMKTQYQVPEEKIEIIPRWVDLNKFKYIGTKDRLKSNFIVSVGRITPSKGYEHLIKAFRKVARHNPYLKLKIIGSTDKGKERYLNYLKTLTRRFSLNYNVEFSGFRHDVETILSQAKVLVAPSLIDEAFGRVVVEAAACGVPVVAAEVGGFQEIIDNGRDGLLIPPADSDSLAEAILKLINDPLLAEKISLRAREKVERLYTMEKALSGLEKVYQKALSQERILVLKFSSLREVLLSASSLACLRRDFPRAKIYLLTLKKYADLFYDSPYLDKVITVSSPSLKLKEIFAAAKKIRRLSFDYIIDLQNNRASRLISFFSFARRSFGLKSGLSFLLSRAASPAKEINNPLKNNETILKLLGVRPPDKNFLFNKEIPFSFTGLQLGQKCLGLSLASGSVYPAAKIWPLDKINAFLKLFLKEYPDYEVVLTGSPGSEKTAEAVVSFHKSQRIVNLCGRTGLPEFAGLLRKLSLFLTLDTAALYLSQSLGVKTIGIFGPTDPKKRAMPSDNLEIIDKQFSCRDNCRRRCRSPECIRSITSKEVFLKVRQVLDQKTKNGAKG